MESSTAAYRYTEMCHPSTENLDSSSTSDMVDLFGACDLEIFDGWNSRESIFDTLSTDKSEILCSLTTNLLKKNQRNTIILSGCGTSGRLAFILSRCFNDKLKVVGLSPAYTYLIAGGDDALFASREGTEDDPYRGIQDLIQVSEGKQMCIFIGITCGLSAPYVAGQLDYCLDHPDRFIPVLLGFNPPNSARKVPIENWDKTVWSVINRMQTSAVEKKAFIWTPIVGPEPLSGSTRMKSGSATKILLESLFTAAHLRIGDNSPTKTVSEIQDTYRLVHGAVYSNKESLSKLITLGGECLCSNGHIYYLGCQLLGKIGMIDASECPPTFGAAPDDVMAFIQDGFTPESGSATNSKIEVSFKDFEEQILPTIQQRDTVVILTSGNHALPHTLLTSPAKKVVIFIPGYETKVAEPLPHRDVLAESVEIKIPWTSVKARLGEYGMTLIEPQLQELACKWVCNALTTGAHVIAGKVYRNLMVDIKVSNNKLYQRAIGIIQKCTECDGKCAEEALLRAIYKVDKIHELHLNKPISAHIEMAMKDKKVVPLALLIVILGGSVEENAGRLELCPVVKKAVDEAKLQTR